jgi:hypothetical protein
LLLCKVVLVELKEGLDEGGRKSGAKGREGIGGGAKAKIRK